MELEALKRGSDKGASVAEGGQAADLAAALKEQTEALKEALSARGGSNSITTVKTDLVWPTLTDDKSDTKDVVLFYEEFEDVCALANNCRGMSAREKLLALRARCKGSRAKTYTNAYRAAWKTGEVVDDPEAVYLRIKNKHLMFGESREEREVRIDGEHQALVKGRLRRPRTAPWRPVLAPKVAGREQRVRSASTSVTTGTVRRATPAPSPTTRSYASRRWLPSVGRAPWPLRAARAEGREVARPVRPRPSLRPSRRPPLSRRRSLLARSARSFRRRARAGRVRTATWCTVCSPGKGKPCRPTGPASWHLAL